jgi:hypothetical protein
MPGECARFASVSDGGRRCWTCESLVGLADQTLRGWDLETGECLATFT